MLSSHLLRPRPSSSLHLLRRYASVTPRGQNLVERIAQRYVVGQDEGTLVRAGDVVSIQPEHILTHDNTGAVMKK
jgi:homoaconitate hydratase